MTRYKCPCGHVDTLLRHNMLTHLTAIKPCAARQYNPNLDICDTIVPGTCERRRASGKTAAQVRAEMARDTDKCNASPTVINHTSVVNNNTLNNCVFNLSVNILPFGSIEEAEYIVAQASTLLTYVIGNKINDDKLLCRYVRYTLTSDLHSQLRSVCVPNKKLDNWVFYEYEHGMPTIVTRNGKDAFNHICAVAEQQLQRVCDMIDPCDKLSLKLDVVEEKPPQTFMDDFDPFAGLEYAQPGIQEEESTDEDEYEPNYRVKCTIKVERAAVCETSFQKAARKITSWGGLIWFLIRPELKLDPTNEGLRAEVTRIITSSVFTKDTLKAMHKLHAERCKFAAIHTS